MFGFMQVILSSVRADEALVFHILCEIIIFKMYNGFRYRAQYGFRYSVQ